MNEQFLGVFLLMGVSETEVDGCPCLMVALRNAEGEEHELELTREMAADLTEMLGPHPLVEKFFATGKGLQ